MTVVSLANRRYTYTHDDQEGPLRVIDAHHIFVQQNTARGFLLCLTILLLLANTFFLLLIKEKPGIHFFCSNLLAVIAIKSVHSKSIKKESVVIMPGLGVQLEKHFGRMLDDLGQIESKLELDSLESMLAAIADKMNELIETRSLPVPPARRRVVRRFVPIGKILKPVLNECVTPITCYWTLGLIVHGEAELLLVFEGLQPPVKMLVPVWKALCAASASKENTDTIVEDDQ